MINWRNHVLLVWFFHDELYMMKLITTLQVFNNHRFLTTFPKHQLICMLLIILRKTSVTSIEILFSNLNAVINCVTCVATNNSRGATCAVRAPKPGKTPIIVGRCRCCRRLLFFRIKVRPRSCRSYHIWRP